MPSRASSWIPPDLWTLFARQQTTAHRLATGPEMWLERFGPDLLLSYRSERGKEATLAELDERCAAYSFVPTRVFGKYLPLHASERGAPAVLRGEAGARLATEVTEAGVTYGLDFGGGYSAGFFIDQRENRARVRESVPQRLLNTFAYTCSFSVVAALAGAETVSIDLSRRSLVRGEENFRRNGIDPQSVHRFVADDVLAVLPRLARRGEKFDLIVLDPPTFSRNQAGGAFQVQRDFEKLLLLALEVATARGRLGADRPGRAANLRPFRTFQSHPRPARFSPGRRREDAVAGGGLTDLTELRNSDGINGMNEWDRSRK